MNPAGGPPPPPPPPPFQVPGAVTTTPKPMAEPTPVRTMPAAPQQGSMPAALAGAMMKDKKPFTYTPGGLDLSEIKSPRMQRRLQRNASLEGARPSPLAQQSSSPHGAAPPMPQSGMVQVLPMPGAGLAPKPKAPPKVPPTQKASTCGPPPPPPPFGLTNGSGAASQLPQTPPRVVDVDTNRPSEALINTETGPPPPPPPMTRNQPPPVQQPQPHTQNGVSRPQDIVNAVTVEPEQKQTDKASFIDTCSEITGSSSPSYPEEMNSIQNHSEDSMDVNTTSSEPEPLHIHQPSLASIMVNRPGLAPETQGQRPCERTVSTQNEYAPQSPYTETQINQQVPQSDYRVVRQSSLPMQTPSPAVKNSTMKKENVFIPPQGERYMSASPSLQQQFSSPGSATEDKPLPWMVGLRQGQVPPPSQFMQEPQRTSQGVQRQNSLPQQRTVSKPEATAPWRQPRAPQSSEQNEQSTYCSSSPGIIPPPDVFKDQSSHPQSSWNANNVQTQQWQQSPMSQPQQNYPAPTNQVAQSYGPPMPQPQQSYAPQMPQAQPTYEEPQGRERIIPIMMEATPPNTPTNYGSQPRFVNLVASSPVRSAGPSVNRSFSNATSTPSTPTSAFVTYDPSYGTPPTGMVDTPPFMQQNCHVGRDQPSQNGPIVYTQNGASPPVQSKSFRVIQNAYNNSEAPSEQSQPEQPRTYSGANIPSRSFKVLQAMTDNVADRWSPPSEPANFRSEENIQVRDVRPSHSTASFRSTPSVYSPVPSESSPSYSNESRPFGSPSMSSQGSEPVKTWRNWRDQSPATPDKCFSPSNSSYRSVSLGPDFGKKPTLTFSDSPSRLMEIVEQETKAMNERGQTVANVYEEASVPSQLLQQLQTDNYVNLRPVADRNTRPTSWDHDNHLTQRINHMNINKQCAVNEHDVSRASSCMSNDYDDMVHDGLMQTAASKQSVLKELTTRFDPCTEHKRPRAAPGKVFKHLQEQYDSLDDQDEIDSRGSSDMRSPSLIRDTLSPSFTSSSSDYHDIHPKTYAGARVPGRTFRMLQQNIGTHPSVLIARK